MYSYKIYELYQVVGGGRRYRRIQSQGVGVGRGWGEDKHVGIPQTPVSVGAFGRGGNGECARSGEYLL